MTGVWKWLRIIFFHANIRISVTFCGVILLRHLLLTFGRMHSSYEI
jgi:hypothetical protein